VLARLSLAYPAVVLEKAGPGTALSRSWSLTKGSTWRVVGIYVLAFLIAGVIVAVVGVPVALVGQLLGLSPALMVIAVTLLDVLVSLVTTPFTAGVISLVYIDQRMRREGLDVQLARAAANRG
ncbi:MAG: glycerophosphoryl diester phosphodiesterase membrane domain-containing protein, partial [Actinomycetaceae bacterium]